MGEKYEIKTQLTETKSQVAMVEETT